MKKITIVGAGGVGSQTAFCIAQKQLGDIVLVDIVEGLPQGKALDISQSLPLAYSATKIWGTNDYKLTADSDIVVVTSGIPRKPGMTRDDLIDINSKIITAVVGQIATYSPNCILIIVTNPLDAMVQLAYNVSKFPKQRVLGMAGALDSARFRAFIAQELGVNVSDVHAMVLGSHGDLMVPVVNYCTINGIPIRQLLSKKKIDAIVSHVRNAGGEIVDLLKIGSATFAPAMAITEMVEAILLDKKSIVPLATYLNGEYGVKGVFVGVPVVLGKSGVEKIVEIKLSKSEKRAFDQSVNYIRDIIQRLQPKKQPQ